ncbi:unnamed protein product, partial [Cladocopium goreaui]
VDLRTLMLFRKCSARIFCNTVEPAAAARPVQTTDQRRPSNPCLAMSNLLATRVFFTTLLMAAFKVTVVVSVIMRQNNQPGYRLDPGNFDARDASADSRTS